MALKLIEGRKFKKGDGVLLDGHHYLNCEFNGCEIVYRGGGFLYESCVTDHETWVFEEAAMNTVNVLRTLCDDDLPLRDAVFPNWRQWSSGDENQPRKPATVQ